MFLLLSFMFFSPTKSENSRVEQVLWGKRGFTPVGGEEVARKGVEG
jgi:hypothetical protein